MFSTDDHTDPPHRDAPGGRDCHALTARDLRDCVKTLRSARKTWGHYPARHMPCRTSHHLRLGPCGRIRGRVSRYRRILQHVMGASLKHSGFDHAGGQLGRVYCAAGLGAANHRGMRCVKRSVSGLISFVKTVLTATSLPPIYSALTVFHDRESAIFVSPMNGRRVWHRVWAARLDTGGARLRLRWLTGGHQGLGCA